MRQFLPEFNAGFKAGSISEEVILEYVNRYARLDAMIPEAQSFFILHEIQKKKVWFLGKLQSSVTGFTNDASLEMGIEFAFEHFHPDDMWTIVKHVYPAFDNILENIPPGERKRVYAQYNYRLRHYSGEYRNLLERVYILEQDESGLPSLLLVNVTLIDREKDLPVCFIGKRVNEFGSSEVLTFKAFNLRNQAFDTVSAREIDVLRRLSLGKTSNDIADELFISKHTVDTHCRHLLKKLGCKSKVGLARIAFANGLL